MDPRQIERWDPDPHQSDKLDPDPHQFSDDKPKCMEYMILLFKHFFKVLNLCLEARIPVLWNRNYFLRFRFRFRFRLLKSYGSGSGSGSDFRKSYGSGSGSGSYFRKVTVPVPVPVPALYLDHKKLIFQTKFWKIFCLFTQLAVLLGKSLYISTNLL
jgi:hypothetical protein